VSEALTVPEHRQLRRPDGQSQEQVDQAGYLQEILTAISQPKFFKLFEPEMFGVFFQMVKANLIRLADHTIPLKKLDIQLFNAWSHWLLAGSLRDTRPEVNHTLGGQKM
jgi:hypothetical protein